MNKKFYQNKLAFILGGSEGIGLSIANDMVKLGSNVIIGSRSVKKLDLAIQELEKNRQSSDQIISSSSVDLTNTEQTTLIMNQWLEKFGTPDFLIINAGFGRPGYMVDLEISHYEEMMNLNYLGCVRTIKPVLPKMIEAKKGHIVLTSSIAGFIGLFGYTGYCPSKAAQISFAESLQAEVKNDGIKVSVLCPPNTLTPGFEVENQYKPDEVLKTEEKIKALSPDEVSKSFIKQLPKNKSIIIPTFDGKFAYFMKNHLPSVVRFFTKRPD
jgi:3-dehydrosphinganine reductase